MKRIALALAALLVATCCAEGLLSLLAGRSLRDLVRRPWHAGSSTPLPSQGLYRPDADPRVAYVLRHGSDLSILGGTIHSDDLGLRARPGPPPPPDALHIVVLGDSVAFGYGLDDDQTIACRIEDELGRVLAPGSRPVACRTVAMPGWNHRNAIWCLRDHLDELQPDIVVYLPITNDLLDTDTVGETGMRRWWPDASQQDPWLVVGQGNPGQRFVLDAGKVLHDPLPDEPAALLGPSGYMSDLSPESSRRYDENAAAILDLNRLLAARGAHLLLAQWREGPYAWILQSRLEADGTRIPELPLFTKVPRELTLGDDPHPNADTVVSIARWIAADLLARGWVQGAAPDAVPPAAAAAVAVHAQPRTTEEVRELADGERHHALGEMKPQVDFTTYEGTGQIIGGINSDGTCGMPLLLALRRAGDSLHVSARAVDGSPSLYPLDVRVLAGGTAVGTLIVAASGISEARFEIPAGGRDAPPVIEVRLEPQDARVVRAPIGPQLEAFRPLVVACQ